MLTATLNRYVRLSQLLFNRVATSSLDALRSQARKIEIKLDRVGELDIAPLEPVAFAAVDLQTEADPIDAILAAPEFDRTSVYFAGHPAAGRSLVSARSQALLYTLLRNLAPDHVVEVGTYKAATTEAMCRAMAANGRGTVHAIDPFRTEYISAILKRWPEILLRHVQLHPVDSMSFFFDLPKRGIRPGLVLVDGNHDYEFALFDIISAARHLRPGGFMVVDNVSLPGPFQAVCNFLAGNPAWIECGGAAARCGAAKAFDPDRSRIRGTDFVVLRAPRTYVVDGRPRYFDLTRQLSNRVAGFRLTLAEPAGRGVLHVQTKLYGYGVSAGEALASRTLAVDGAGDAITVSFDPPLRLEGEFSYFTVEPWLSWESERPLLLRELPQPF